MEIWTPVMGEILVVKIEPMNRHDIYAMAIYRDTEIVGHVPYNLAPIMSAFFMGVMAAGCWSELKGGCFWEGHLFGYSRKVGCFLEGLLREVLLYILVE